MGGKLTKGVFSLVTDARDNVPKEPELDFLGRPPPESWSLRERLDKAKVLQQAMGRPQNALVAKTFSVFAIAVAVIPIACFYVTLHGAAPVLAGSDGKIFGLDRYGFAGLVAVAAAVGLQVLYVLVSFALDGAAERRDTKKSK